MEELIKSIEEILKDEIIKVVISNKANNNVKYNKISIMIKESKKKKYYQIEKFTDKQVFHENIEIEILKDKLIELISESYRQVGVWSENATYEIKISKKGKVNLSKRLEENKNKVKKSHNKEKNYILKEGMLIEPLIDLGIFTKEGKIINSKYDKYKQINRFIEIIDDEIKEKNYNDLTILDFGCGKSYLTFVLYYYFNKIKGINVNMIGLDLKEDVINKCNTIAKNYNYDNLHFELGDINGYKYTDKVDMVITLHACDTATDYALYNAIKWKSKMIFSVPCCQHELNQQMKAENLKIITRYGIVKERMSALLTDSIRANLLEAVGYKTQILEFIDISHSPKNILIRGSLGKTSKEKKDRLLQEVMLLIKEFNINPKLYELLKNDDLI